MITVKDLQAKNQRSDFNDNKIRKAWVLQTPTRHEEMFKKIPQESRFALYESIDIEVGNEWVRLMRAYREDLAQKGIKVEFNMKDCIERLPDEYCIDCDELLIQAGENVVATFDVEFKAK
ncbi:hypothetical protein [Yersinia phage MHG19]|nr:hypothetical protein [Yersinia phage MHG19]